MSFLLPRGVDTFGDSRRIVAGIVALAVLSVTLLNLRIYQTGQERVVDDGREQLVARTDRKLEELHALFGRLQNEASFVLSQSHVRSRIEAAGTREISAEERTALDAEMFQAAGAFGFSDIHLIDAQGRRVAGTPLMDGEDFGSVRDVARRAFQSRAVVLGDVRELDHRLETAIATPVLGNDGRIRAVGVFEFRIEQAIAPILSRWTTSGAGTGGYLVRREGSTVEFLTPPPAIAGGFQVGQRVPERDPRVRAAAMAIAGVVTNAELDDRAHGRQLVATRFLPEIGWGLVGQSDRAALMTGMRGTLAGLLGVDLAIVALAAAGFWLWRRQYATGLARREMEITLRHADRVQAVFDTAFDAILTFDRKGRVRTANRAAEVLFGRGAADMENEAIQRFLQWGADGQATRDLPATGAVCRSEALRADGTVIPVEFSLGTSGEGEDLRYTAIVRDISERVESERRIRSIAEGLENSNRRLEEVNAQLEEASRLKSEFLANTSHELRTPLNGMIGFLQLVLDGMCDSPEEERDFQKQALQCSRHLLGLINDVLDIAKIEAGKLTLEIEKVDVQSLFDEAYTLTHVQAAQKGVKLEFVTPTDRDHAIKGDFGKIKQVLINLVGNSLKFTPSGSITVRATPHPDLGHFMFEVVDTGIGIASDRQKVIFEKFTQGDGSTTRKYGGTGLGLAITRSLVELMGGIIGVQSDGEGKGTRMYFSVPVWHEGEEEAPEVDEHAGERISGPAGGALLLVVEDDATFRHYLVRLLQQSGYRTVEAHHAEAGWLLARRMRPSVVVLDYALTCPENATIRTGWDLAERMTSDPKTRHIPLVFVTGFDTELRDKLKATAFARRPEHLVKPIDGSVLVGKIEELCGSIEGRIVRVLMADDDPAVSAYIRKVLPEERFHIEIASNGEECLHILRTQPRGFDLLLLDLMMPEVSGYDVLREMALTGNGADLPVLVLTNFPEPRNDEERRLLEEGLVLDVLPKSSVHDNPKLLPHIIDWHLQVAVESAAIGSQDGELPPLEEAA